PSLARQLDRRPRPCPHLRHTRRPHRLQTLETRHIHPRPIRRAAPRRTTFPRRTAQLRPRRRRLATAAARRHHPRLHHRPPLHPRGNQLSHRARLLAVPLRPTRDLRDHRIPPSPRRRSRRPTPTRPSPHPPTTPPCAAPQDVCLTLRYRSALNYPASWGPRVVSSCRC